MPPTNHAVLSASSAHRWLKCPGSVRLSIGVVSPPSEYAEEGTAAHQLAEWCLTEGCDTKAKIGKTIRRCAATGKMLAVTAEMADHVQVYVDNVRATSKALPGSKTFIEQKFKLWITDGMFGTNDACTFQPFGKMVVHDLKYGAGVSVDVEKNDQLMYYGLGAIGKDNPHAVEEVELVITQPRCPIGTPIKRWSTTPEELYQWANDVLAPGAKLALTEDAPLHPGDHCQFCPAKSFCPAIRDKALESAKLAFGPGAVPSKKDVVLPPPKALSMDHLEQVVEVAELIGTWTAAVKEELFNRLKGGVMSEKFKLVEGRATRKWADETAVIEALKPLVDVWETTLLSPAGMERRMKDANLKPKEIAALLEPLVSVSRGVSVVPVSDKRPALNAVNVFPPFAGN